MTNFTPPALRGRSAKLLDDVTIGLRNHLTIKLRNYLTNGTHISLASRTRGVPSSSHLIMRPVL